MTFPDTDSYLLNNNSVKNIYMHVLENIAINSEGDVSSDFINITNGLWVLLNYYNGKLNIILYIFAGFTSNSSNIISTIITKYEIFKGTFLQPLSDYINRSQSNENDGKYIAAEMCYNNPLPDINV